MTTKELLIQEIENLQPELITQALQLIRSIKVDAKRELEAKPAESGLLNDSTQTFNGKEKITYRPASGRSILRHAGTWQGDDYKECLESV
ncbi:hypothetical protein CAL7716_096060 [Calothrix sp. PCC 7716]|nr:hypothetical protein CAL7716_096060 [Calothrix sp. PCC 7716]